LRWSAPDSDGGETIQNYAVEFRLLMEKILNVKSSLNKGQTASLNGKLLIEVFLPINYFGVLPGQNLMHAMEVKIQI